MSQIVTREVGLSDLNHFCFSFHHIFPIFFQANRLVRKATSIRIAKHSFDSVIANLPLLEETQIVHDFDLVDYHNFMKLLASLFDVEYRA